MLLGFPFSYLTVDLEIIVISQILKSSYKSGENKRAADSLYLSMLGRP